MCTTRHLLKADLALAAEALLCLSLFGPQPLAWAYVVEHLLPRDAGAGLRVMLVLAATAAGIVATLALARGADEVRAKAMARAGRPDRGDPLTLLVVLLASALGTVAFVWFFFGGGYTPMR